MAGLGFGVGSRELVWPRRRRNFSDGDAKFRDWPSWSRKEATPTTRPWESRTGEPLDPWDIGALIWRTSRFSLGRLRRAETMPSVKVPSSPRGLPMTAILVPASADPSGARVRKGRSLASSCRRARSLRESVATTRVIGKRPPFSALAMMVCASAMTCWLVTRSPWEEMTKPVPAPMVLPSSSCRTRRYTAGRVFLARVRRSGVSFSAMRERGRQRRQKKSGEGMDRVKRDSRKRRVLVGDCERGGC